MLYLDLDFLIKNENILISSATVWFLCINSIEEGEIIYGKFSTVTQTYILSMGDQGL